MSQFLSDTSLWRTARRTEIEETYVNGPSKVRCASFPLTDPGYQRYLTNLRQKMNQRPLSELETNVTLFGKNVVTVHRLTAGQSTKKEAHFLI